MTLRAVSRFAPFVARRCGGVSYRSPTSHLLSLMGSISSNTNHCDIHRIPLPSTMDIGQRFLSSSGSTNNNNNNDSTYTPLPSSNPSRKKRSDKTKKRRKGGRLSYRFVDRTRVQVSGGSGGNGSRSMHHLGRKRKRKPDGGHGGNGGSVLILADPKEQSLRWTRPHVTAESGAHGGNQGKHGRNGRNTILRVPCGVVVRRVLDHDEYFDAETRTVRKLEESLVVQTNEEQSYELWEGKRSSATASKKDNDDYLRDMERHRQAGGYLASLDYDSDEEDDDDDDDEYAHAYKYDNSDDDDDHDVFYNYSDQNHDDEQGPVEPSMSFTTWGEREIVEIADLDKPGSHIVVARGGRGGYGNSSFASVNGPLPSPEIMAQHAEPELGEVCRLELELKLIADIGLVGFPNAGKSSLLSATSRATPHIAPYPFTTLNPLVGYIEYKDGFRVCAADVPGLIAGASEGRGQGHDFLRHLERTKALLYIVDAAGIDGRDPIEDFEVLVHELSAYGDGDMLNRRCLVVANKIDLLLEDEREDIFAKLQERADAVGIRMEADVIGISAGATGENLPLLTKSIRRTVLSSENDKTNELGYA